MRFLITESSFKELFDKHYTELCKVVYPIVQDATVGEDIVQGVFVKLWERRDKVNISESAFGYLYRACVLSAISETRKMKTRRVAGEELTYLGKQASSTVSEDERREGLKVAIQQSLGALPEKTQTIFILSRKVGLKNREIAEFLDVSIKTVEAHMGKALKHLRQDLSPYATGLSVLFLVDLYLFGILDRVFDL